MNIKERSEFVTSNFQIFIHQNIPKLEFLNIETITETRNSKFSGKTEREWWLVGDNLAYFHLHYLYIF